MMANSGSDEATLFMAKNLSDEAFNAGIEIEAMKRLTLHRFCCPALLVHRYLFS
jgi:hypothetical protein